MKEKTNIASEVLKYHALWEQISKATIADNIEKYLCVKYPQCNKSYKAKMEVLVEISGSKKDSVYSWLNRSRENVKVPFLKLCNIAQALDVDIQDLLNENEK